MNRVSAAGELARHAAAGNADVVDPKGPRIYRKVKQVRQGRVNV